MGLYWGMLADSSPRHDTACLGYRAKPRCASSGPLLVVGCFMLAWNARQTFATYLPARITLHSGATIAWPTSRSRPPRGGTRRKPVGNVRTSISHCKRRAADADRAPTSVEDMAVEFERYAPSWAVGTETVDRRELLRPWSWGELENFPRRTGGSRCLDPKLRVADLTPELRVRTWAYLHQCNPYSPSLGSVFGQIDTDADAKLRVKELFESCEAVKLILRWVSQLRRKGRNIGFIFDAACGHGIVGMLLAHCLPHVEVDAVDWQTRPLTHVAGQAWTRLGRPLGNFKFVNGDMLSVPLSRRLDAASLVVGIHVCNEAMLDILDFAQDASAAWAVMPCCMRRGLYLPKGSGHLEEHVHYPVMCGVLANARGAQTFRHINQIITPKNLFIAGAAS